MAIVQDMDQTASPPSHIDCEPVSITCADGVVLGAHLWPAQNCPVAGRVIINPATGVLARYYHRYARFLAQNGFEVLTYDYRGIGLSRPARLRGCGYLWRDWGEKDFEAALNYMGAHLPDTPLMVVGHSIGGFLPGLAASAHNIDRMLTMGAQFAWWKDYAREQRWRLFLKWHVAMPATTALFGYFPGRKLGWLEDLPSGVAHEWSFRGPRFEKSHPKAMRNRALSSMASVRAPILAVAMSDDELGTASAIRRTLAYYTNAPRTAVLLHPSDYGYDQIGHFSLFRDTHAPGFWKDTLAWLQRGENPWPERILPLSGHDEKQARHTRS